MTQPESRRSIWDRVREHPVFDIAALYAGASWAVLQGVDLLFAPPAGTMRLVGIALLAGFLPVALLVRRSAARRTPAAEPALAEAAAVPARGRLSGRRLIALVVAFFALGTGAWWARPLLWGSVTPGADLIAVLPFSASGSGVELLGEGMVDLLSTNLDQVGGIRTVNARTVLHRWKQRAVGGAIDLEGALAVGQEVSAGSVLMGSAVAAGPKVRLTAELYAVKGDELARVQAEGEAKDVLALVDDLSVRLLREIWRSREPLPTVRVSAITTSSLPAVREYLRGEQFFRRSQWDSAGAAFEAAVRHDSTFALAHYRMAETYGWREGHGSRAARGSADAAVRYADRLPGRERSLVVVHQLHERSDLAALDSLQAYLSRYPDDVGAWNQLGDIQFHARAVLGLPADALYAPFDSVLRLDPTFAPALTHPLEASLMVGDTARFHGYMDRLRSGTSPAEARIHELAASVRWAQPESALAVFGRTTRNARGPRDVQKLASFMIAATYRTPGRSPDDLVAAWDTLYARIGAGRPVPLDFRIAHAFILIGFGRLDAADVVIDSLAKTQRHLAGVRMLPVLAGYAPASYAGDLSALGGPDVPYVRAQYFQAMARLSRGDAAGARKLIDPALARAPDPKVEPRASRPLLTAAGGWVQILEGDTAAGIQALEGGLRAAGYTPEAVNNGAPLRFQLALALAASPATRARGIARLRALTDDPLYSVPAYLALAQTLEESGDRAGAAEAYAHVVRLWEKADPVVQPRVEAARRALARLTAEGGR